MAPEAGTGAAQVSHLRPTGVRTKQLGQIGFWQSVHLSRVTTPSRGQMTSVAGVPPSSLTRRLPPADA
jgi:hypothetical protein